MKYIVSIVLAGVMFMALLPATAQVLETTEWEGRLQDGQSLSVEGLAKIAKEHKEWLLGGGKGKHGMRASLREADLRGADLREADLRRADLNGAYLNKTCLRNADLGGADLRGAYLFGADLRETDLRGADLREADLREADLRRADLRAANLKNTKLKEANASFADFSYSLFQPENIEALVFLGTKGFSTIEFDNFKAVAELRKIARECGLRNEERALTAALRKYRLRALPLYERIFEYILLDLPTDSGANPWRSFYVLACFIVIFSFFYMIVLMRQGEDGIWKIWIPERVRKDMGKQKPTRLTLHGLAVVWVGLYFSVLSAFNIGWRELNVGNWIARIQRREYIYRATGWTRTVSGIQSLLSVYLLALWALTYFGRPFE